VDLVLGLSMTSTAVRWVLVEGTTGDGAPIDRGALDIAATGTFDADGLLDALLDGETAAESRVHAVGVSWTTEAEVAASTLLQALAARGLENVIAVSEIEAADALARGIAEIAEYDNVAVCIVEPDAAVVAVVNAEGVTVDHIDRPLDRADAVELTSRVIALMDLNDRRPDAIFVLGSDDLDPIVSSLADIATSPVISATEADLALARGAALASALAVNTLEAQAALMRPRGMSKIGALTSVLVAAVVIFVVSLSAALGLRLTPDSRFDQPQNANAAEERARAATPPSVARAVPPAPRPAAPGPAPAAPPPKALPPAAETIPAAALPPVYVPPAPAYVPPPPAAVPPPVPQPRLRDRIIERIPIIGRFHEPKPQYPR
jgi:hypothetical protein